jgi:hypothetical protein
VLLSEFSKVRKEQSSGYKFIIADYRNGFRLRVFADAEDPWRFIKAGLAIELGTIAYVLGAKAELN